MSRTDAPTKGRVGRTAALAVALTCCCVASLVVRAADANADAERLHLLSISDAYADIADQVGAGLVAFTPGPIAFAWAQLNARGLGMLHNAKAARIFWYRAEAIARSERWTETQAQVIDAHATLDLQSGELGTARDAALRARALSRESGNAGEEFRADMILGNSLRLLGEISGAQAYASAAADLASPFDDAAQAQALSLLAVLAKNKGDYLQSLQFDIDALRHEVASGDAQRQALTLSKLGQLYEQMEDDAKALDCEHQALFLAEGSVTADALAHILVSYANVLNDVRPDEHERALDYASRALDSALRTGNRSVEIDGELQVARAHFNASRLDSAAASFTHALATAREIGQRVSLAHLLLRQGELFERRGRLREAIANTTAAVAIYRQGDNLPRLITSYAILERQLDASGEHSAAREMRLSRFELRDRVLGAGAVRALVALEDRSREETQKQQIELLQRQGEIDALRIDRQALQRWLMLLFAVASGATLLLVAWRFQSILRINRLLKQKNQEVLHQQYALEEINAELRSSAQQLFTAATTDALTGTVSRTHGLALLDAEIDAARVGGEVLSVLLVDVDNFKQVNDSHGHLHGDRALATIARLLRAKLRPTESIVRFGGEEFLIFLPRTSPEAAIAVADRMRADIDRQSLKSEPHLHLNVSIGVCATAQLETVSVETLLGGADKALYAAKHAGRNRVRAYPLPGGDASAPAPNAGDL